MTAHRVCSGYCVHGASSHTGGHPTDADPFHRAARGPTNTVPVAVAERTEKLRVLSIAPALAEAVRRIHNGESVSALFEATRDE